MPDMADKPFASVLAEDVRYDPRQGVLMNVGNNLARAGDKVLARNQWRERARQMEQAIDEWRQGQAAIAQQVLTPRRPPPPMAPLMGRRPRNYLA